MRQNRSKMVLLTLFFVSFDEIPNFADAQSLKNRLQVQWVPEIHETKDAVPRRKSDSSESVVYVCENSEKEYQIEWCDEALKIFASTYPYGTVRFQPDSHLEPVRWYRITEKSDKQTKEDLVQACKCPLDWQIYLKNDIITPNDDVIALIKRPKYLKPAEPEPSDDNRIANHATTSTCTHRRPHRSQQNDNESTTSSAAPTRGNQRNLSCDNCGDIVPAACTNCANGCSECCNCFLGCCLDGLCRPTSYHSHRNAPRTQADVDAAFWNGWIMNDVSELVVRCLGLVCENIGPVCEHIGNNMDTYGGCLCEICGTCCADASCCIEFIGHCLNPTGPR